LGFVNDYSAFADVFDFSSVCPPDMGIFILNESRQYKPLSSDHIQIPCHKDDPVNFLCPFTTPLNHFTPLNKNI